MRCYAPAGPTDCALGSSGPERGRLEAGSLTLNFLREPGALLPWMHRQSPAAGLFAEARSQGQQLQRPNSRLLVRYLLLGLVLGLFLGRLRLGTQLPEAHFLLILPLE